jgi:membrane protease YdiL (CAAX protease family)
METKSYPGIIGALILCFLVVGVQLLLGTTIGLVTGLFETGTGSIVSRMGTIFVPLVSFGVVIFIGIKKSKKNCNALFKFNKVSPGIWLATIICALGLLIVLSELDNVFNYFLPMPQSMQSSFITTLTDQMFIVAIIVVGIIPAFTEEMLFRGIILNGLAENYSERKAILISSLLFGLTHLNPWQFLSAFIIGVLSAWLCIRTKSIVLSIYIHGFNNIVSAVALKYRDAMPITGLNTYFNSQSEFLPKWLDAAGIILFIAGIMLLMRAIKKTKNGA